MEEDNNNKTWNERIAEYVMSGQAGPGLREQIESVESQIYKPSLTKEEMDEALKGMYTTEMQKKKKSKIFMPLKEYEDHKEYLEAFEAKIMEQLTKVYSADMARTKMIVDGTYENFIKEFNENNPEWADQKKNSTTNDLNEK